MNDEELVRLLQAGRIKGLSVLYDRYSSPLYGVIYRILRNHEVSEEILQDTFMKIWQQSQSYDPEKGKFLNWIVNIARNTAIDRVRLKRFNRKNAPLEQVGRQMIENPVNPETIGLKEIVSQLSEEQRSIIDLIYYQGFTQSETADELGLPLGTVKTRLYRAINKLSKIFSQ